MEPETPTPPASSGAAAAPAGAPAVPARERRRRRRHRIPTLGVAVGATLATLYGAAAVGIWWYLRSQGYATITVADVALPHRWDGMRRKQGAELVDRALKKLEAGEGQEGFFLLRAGLQRVPDHEQGRLVLSEIYRRNGAPDAALRTLEDGLGRFQPSAGYFQALVTLMLRERQDERVIALAERFLPGLDAKAAPAAVLALASAAAHRARGQTDAAAEIVERHGLVRLPAGQELMAEISWDRGRTTVAMEGVARLSREFPLEDRYYALLARYQGELGLATERRATLELRRAANPQLAEPWIEWVVAVHGGDPAAFDREAAAYLKAFGADRSALLNLAQAACDLGRPEWVRRVMDEPSMARVAAVPVLELEAMVNAGRVAEALQLIAEARSARPRWYETSEGAVASLEVCALYRAGRVEEAGEALTAVIPVIRERPASLLPFSRQLRRAGAGEFARRVLQVATELPEPEPAAILELVLMDIEECATLALPRRLDQLLAERRPPAALVRRTVRLLESDRFLFLRDRNRYVASLRELAPDCAGAGGERCRAAGQGSASAIPRDASVTPVSRSQAATARL